MPIRKSALLWFTFVLALYEIAVIGSLPTWAGIFVPTQMHGAISLAAALSLIFIGFSSAEDRATTEVPGARRGIAARWCDLALIASTLAGTGYVVFFHDNLLDYVMYGFLDTTGLVLALLLVVPLIEAVRRVTGWALPIIILFFVALTMFQPYLPGRLYGAGYGPDRLLFSAYVGDAGIFGLPLKVATGILIVYLIFGALMHAAGAGKWFIELALSLTGWSRGGPAKVAVLSSAMFGSVTGSPAGNAATTGVFTIPMMTRIGYRPSFAAAVEAVASTGGQILPPVMGAIAFVMAEWLEIPYGQIAIAATIPAVLYFLIVFVSVHLQAHRHGIRALPRSEIPPFWPVLRRGWFYLIPFGVLVYFLIIRQMPPGVAGTYAIAAAIGCSFLSRDRAEWLTLRRIALAFQAGVKAWVVIVAVTGAVGIMVGALELSGVGIKISGFILDLAGNNLLMALVLVGLASLILGMGLDAIPAYITLATLTAPALVRLGVPDMAAHLFVIYWGLASFFTPPTCIAVFVTCGLSGSKIWETGWEAVRLGIAAFLIPFAFVLNDGLLLQGGIGHIVLAVGTAVVGSVFLSCGICGYALWLLNPVQRVLFAISGLLFIAPGIYLPLAGLAIVLTATVLGRRRQVVPTI